MSTTTATSTLASVKERQVIWPKWMQDRTAGLADNDLVVTTTKVTPFGNYLLDVQPA